MSAPRPRCDKEEFARRGDAIYDRDIGPEYEGKFVAIDIETGAYEIDRDELVASDRLLARRSDAQMWTRRARSRYALRHRTKRSLPSTIASERASICPVDISVHV